MSTDDHTTKRCVKCNQEFPLDRLHFAIRKHGSIDGFENRCRNCERARQREQKRRSRAEHPEREKASKQRYYAKHGAKVRQSVSEYRQRHPDQVSASKKRHYRANTKQYRLQGERYRARRRGLPDNLKHSDWRQCLEYFSHRCAICGRPAGLWHTIVPDHWIPLNSPDCPGTVPLNIIPLCHSANTGAGGCNNSKKDKNAAEWLAAKFGKRKAKQILKKIEEYFKSLAE